ncbi:hypothetical protein ElyMa_003732200 [Elysia marginata]|uniref:Uncharacterized protein n=1 Tax=Elysia marginata TaxID=1093978 RepID=A0AAV4F4X5_9GAST|nr:hypothetical protein ElyMa_003732200 [Elysia marginata]
MGIRKLRPHLVYLRPKYTPMRHREQPKQKTVLVWTPEIRDELRACFDCTDWNVFVNSTVDVSELADTVCAYIKFCIDCVVPCKIIKLYPNNKPWVTKDIKHAINKKKLAFKDKNANMIKEAQKELKYTIRKGKKEHRQKIEK